MIKQIKILVNSMNNLLLKNYIVTQENNWDVNKANIHKK
jgi:hypothetical protein